MKKPSPKIKVLLSEDVTARVKAEAKREFSTTPRIVNKTLSQHLPKKP